MTMSEHMQLGAALDAGLLAGLLRAIFGGESLFVQTVTASDDGDATFCAEEVGDIELINLHGGGDVLVQKGAFLVSHDTVELHSTTQLSARKVVHCPQSQSCICTARTCTLHMHISMLHAHVLTGVRLGRGPLCAQGLRPRHARRECLGRHLEVLPADHLRAALGPPPLPYGIGSHPPALTALGRARSPSFCSRPSG